MMRMHAPCLLVIVFFLSACNHSESDTGTAATPPAADVALLTPGNRAPVGSDLAIEVDEDTTAEFNLAVSDPDGDALTLAWEPPVNGKLSVTDDDGETRAIYTPNPDYHGSDSIEFTASDGTAQSSPFIVTLAIRAVNDPPVAVALARDAMEDQALEAQVTATDIDGDALTYRAIGAPASGTLELAADGGFRYFPNANFAGADHFEFVANDGVEDSAAARVEIEVATINDVPKVADDQYVAGEDMALQIAAAGVLANDTDADGDALTATLSAAPAHGSLELAADGSFVYLAEANFSGMDRFHYEAGDGSVTAPGTVTIMVMAKPDTPVAFAAALETSEDQALAGHLSGSDADGDALQFELIGEPVNGTLVLVTDGSFVYTPAADFNGNDSFRFTASDGTSASAPATVAISVLGTPDTPLATGQALTTPEDETLTGQLEASDADEDELTFLIGDAAGHGSVNLAADGQFRYEPEPDFHGTDSFTFSASDGALESAAARIAITVGPVNDAPAFASTPITRIDEDTAFRYDIVARDPDGEALTISASSPLPAWLGLVDLGDGSGQLLGFPTDAEIGMHSVALRVTDARGATDAQDFVLSVDPVNDAPAFLSTPPASVDEDGTYIYEVAVGDEDAGDILSITPASPLPAWLGLVDQGAGIALVAGVPIDDDIGSHSIALAATDLAGAQTIQQFTLTVLAVNDAPEFSSTPVTTATADDIYEYRVHASDEEDGPAVTIAPATPLPPWLGLLDLGEGNALLTGIPTNDDVGPTEVRLQAKDATGLATVQLFTLTVEAGNQAPDANPDQFSVAVGNTSLYVGLASAGEPALVLEGSLLDNDSDPEGSPLFVANAGNTVSAAGGTVGLQTNGRFYYLPPAGYTGTDRFGYRVGDGELESEASVEITVSGMVWYVDESADGSEVSDGRSAHPFRTVAEAVAASAPGATIYLHEGEYAGGITLQNAQSLIGAGVELVVDNRVLAPAAGGVTLGDVAGAAVTLASDNRLEGFAIDGALEGIVGADVGRLTVGMLGGMSVHTSGGPALALAGGGVVAAQFAGLHSAGSATNGISVRDIDAGSHINVSDIVIVSGAAQASVDLRDNPGSSVEINALHITGDIGLRVSECADASLVLREVSITTYAGDALRMKGAGQLAIHGETNRLDATGGAALALITTNISPDGLRFERISARDADYGIFLQDTGPHSLTVTGGDGGNASGGLIENMVNSGIRLDATGPVDLRAMHIRNAEAHGIHASAATDLGLETMRIEGNGGTGDAALRIEDPAGLYSLIGLELIDNRSAGLEIIGREGVLDSLYVSDLWVEGGEGDGVSIVFTGEARLASAFIEDVVVRDVAGTGIYARAGATATASGGRLEAVRIDRPEIRNAARGGIWLAAEHTGFARFEILEATAIETADSSALTGIAEGDGDLGIELHDSSLRMEDSPLAHASAVVLQTQAGEPGDQPRLRASLAGNDIEGGGAHGILAAAGGAHGVFDLFLDENRIAGAAVDGINIHAGNERAGESDLMRVYLRNNEASGGTAGFSFSVRGNGPRVEIACDRAISQACSSLIGGAGENAHGIIAAHGNTTLGGPPAVAADGTLYIIDRDAIDP